MMNRNRSAIAVVMPTLVLSVAGCATAPSEPGFDQVRGQVEQHSDYAVHWYQNTEADEQVEQQVRELLEQDLAAEGDVQIALLNNRQLQATYQDLGVAQADFVQAGLLSNPAFSGEFLFPVDGGPVELELSVAQSFLEMFAIPLRRRIVESQFEQAKLAVTGAVFDLAYQTRIAFYATQAGGQRAGRDVRAERHRHRTVLRLRPATLRRRQHHCA